jgi:hypothetical protein
MYNRKGQAALEFMMTYGWAILVVLAAIGALSYFGILNPSRFTPDTCLASSGFSCPGKPILTTTGPNGGSQIAFTIINGLGYPIVLNNSLINLSSSSSSTLVTYCPGAVTTNVGICPLGNISCTGGISPAQTVQDGSGVTIVINNCNFASANVVKGDISLQYVNPNSRLTESLLVSITGKPK